MKILMLISMLTFLIVFLTIPYDSCRMCSIEYNNENYTGVEMRNLWNENCSARMPVSYPKFNFKFILNESG